MLPASSSGNRSFTARAQRQARSCHRAAAPCRHPAGAPGAPREARALAKRITLIIDSARDLAVGRFIREQIEHECGRRASCAAAYRSSRPTPQANNGGPQ
jgi:hypothetical protein